MAEKFHRNYAPFIDYYPAELRENKIWYIEYKVKDPETNEFVRKRIKINRIKSIVQRRKYAQTIVQNLNLKLAQGWSPFYEDEPQNAYLKLTDAIEAFEKDKRYLRQDSTRSYKSFIKIFLQFLEKDLDIEMSIIAFKKQYAVSFMDYIYNIRNVNPNTYNNYLVFMKLIFNWFIEHNYCKANPFSDLKKKKESHKQRIMDIDVKSRKKIQQYLIKNDFEFFVMVLMAFNCLLRPKEITYMKVKDINLKDQVIFIDGINAKNHNDRIATIPDTIIPYLKRLNLETKNGNHYLFSDQFMVGTKKIDPRKISRQWSTLRDILKLPKQIQFYSLRDSGIIQLLKDGVSPKEVLELADHSSLEITNKYVKHARMEASEAIKKGGTHF